MVNEREAWDRVKKMHGINYFEFGESVSAQYRTAPSDLISKLAFYKFAAKMFRTAGKVLELHCGEGFGIPVLSEFSAVYSGLETDEKKRSIAIKNFSDDKYSFFSTPENLVTDFDNLVADLMEWPIDFELLIKKRLHPEGVAVLRFADRDSLKKGLDILKKIFVHIFDFSAGQVPFQTDHVILLCCNLQQNAERGKA